MADTFILLWSLPVTQKHLLLSQATAAHNWSLAGGICVIENHLGLGAGSCSLGCESPWLKCSWLLHPLLSQMGGEVFCRGCHCSAPALVTLEEFVSSP